MTSASPQAASELMTEISALSLTSEETDLLGQALLKSDSGATIKELLHDCVAGDYRLFRYLHPSGGRAILAVSILQKSKKNKEFFVYLMGGKDVMGEYIEDLWTAFKSQARELKCNQVGFIGTPRLSRTFFRKIKGLKATHVRMIEEIE